MKKYQIEILYTQRKNDEIPLVHVVNAQIDESGLISFNNYRFMCFKRIENEETINFIKRTVKTIIFKQKYKFIKDIRVTERR